MGEVKKQLNLPTASRLVGAILLAGTTVAMYFVLLAQFPDSTDTTYRMEYHQETFLGLFAAVGIWIGWRSLGTRAAGYPRSGITLGIQAGIAATLYIVLGLSIRYGAVKMQKNAYGADTVGALLDMSNQGLFYMTHLANPVVLGSAVGLSALAGVLTVTAGRHWR